VEVGHRTALETEIIRGLKPGEAVILYPPNDLKEGAAVTSISGLTAFEIDFGQTEI
jgi:hypothetical protein